MKISLTQIQVLEYIVVGIKNGKYQAAIDIAQECINEMIENRSQNIESRKEKSTVLQVQNVKATVKIDTVGGEKDGKKRT